MKRFEKNGKTLVFYKKENDDKFSFLIENEPELTELLIANVNSKRVAEKSIRFAVDGIWQKLQELSAFSLTKENAIELKNNLLTKNFNAMENSNPIIELAEKCQKIYRKNIETRVLGKKGEDHCPTVYVEIELPDGQIFKGKGNNQKEAKQKAAQKALEKLGY